jgi:hypothetical protein
VPNLPFLSLFPFPFPFPFLFLFPFPFAFLSQFPSFPSVSLWINP